jgi:hypothetical protein
MRLFCFMTRHTRCIKRYYTINNLRDAIKLIQEFNDYVISGDFQMNLVLLRCSQNIVAEELRTVRAVICADCLKCSIKVIFD